MRYFITGFVAIVCLIVSMAGFRGSFTRNTPIEVFPDMDRQARVRPQASNLFDEVLGAGDGRGSRLPVAGSVARGTAVGDEPKHTGRQSGSEDWVELNPLEVDDRTLKRGRERYDIFCAPCHGQAGDGSGIVTQYSLTTADLHQHRLVQSTDGYLFDVISNGFNATTNAVGIAYSRMPAYKSKISIQDRWAIVSYIRVLQFSQLGKLEDVTDLDKQAELKEAMEGN
ncbi:MAG: cytochrome c [Verrucomicrobiota bacterium]|nr:cytochrome c [Verrucomicrobiota bacterium]